MLEAINHERHVLPRGPRGRSPGIRPVRAGAVDLALWQGARQGVRRPAAVCFRHGPRTSAGRASTYPACSQVTAHPNRTGFLHTSWAIT
jgi:hypothetical protein